MKYVIFAFVLVIAGCGGGGGNSVQPATSSLPATQSNVIAVQGKVIDGYVAGATVFVDMNWSLAWEQGEPKTTTDANGNYRFTLTEFASFPCYQSPTDPRAIIVDVPAGAVDTTRGVVPAPYRMVYLPVRWLGGTSTKAVTNVTPFTSLFASAIAQGRSQTIGAENGIIPVSESCGALSNLIAANVKTVVGNMGEIFADAGISLDSFYDDFIAANDNAARLKGEQIVDYLIKYKAVSDFLITDLQLEYNVPPGTFYGTNSFNSSVIKAILEGDQSVVSFDIYTRATITPPSTGRALNFIIRLDGLKLRKDGMIVSSSCQSSDPYSCSTISGTNSQALTKAATNSVKTLVKQQGDRFVFYKVPRNNNTFECEAGYQYQHRVSNPSITNTPIVTELQYFYRPMIASRQSLYDCSLGVEGVRVVKRVEYTPKSNGYYYSAFVYSAPTLTSTITNNFPYSVNHFSQDFQTSTLNETQIQNELNLMPYAPKQLGDVASKYTQGHWHFITGSDSEYSVFGYSAEYNLYSCTVISKTNSAKLRETTQSSDPTAALAMCYPDLSSL